MWLAYNSEMYGVKLNMEEILKLVTKGKTSLKKICKVRLVKSSTPLLFLTITQKVILNLKRNPQINKNYETI